MSFTASIEWTGDKSCILTLVNPDANQETNNFVIATLLKGAYNSNGIVESAQKVDNGDQLNLSTLIQGTLLYTTTSLSASINSLLTLTFNNSVEDFVSKIFVCNISDSQARELSYRIGQGWAQGFGDATAANDYIEAQTWDYIFERSQATPLSTPTGLYADNITSDSARVSWNAVENASGYKVEYRQSAGGGQTYPWIEAQD